MSIRGSGTRTHVTTLKDILTKTLSSERASLISMIEAQRIELKQREQAQSDATKIAKRFSAAILAFEDRLVQSTFSSYRHEYT